eukprot:140588-Chlamydomonas_euryale.AAC.2
MRARCQQPHTLAPSAYTPAAPCARGGRCRWARSCGQWRTMRSDTPCPSLASGRRASCAAGPAARTSTPLCRWA